MRSTKYHVSITLVSCVLSGLSDGIQLHLCETELRYRWWSNGFQLHLCEAHNCVVTGGATAYWIIARSNAKKSSRTSDG